MTTNFRCKAGELDLIMLDQDCLVIVEVRYRVNNSYGGPLFSVSRAKQQRICRATQFFLQCHKSMAGRPLRFDVLALCGPPDTVSIDWRKRAFDASSQ